MRSSMGMSRVTLHGAPVVVRKRILQVLPCILGEGGATELHPQPHSAHGATTLRQQQRHAIVRLKIHHLDDRAEKCRS